MLRGLITQNYPPAPGQQTLTERHGKSVAAVSIYSTFIRRSRWIRPAYKTGVKPGGLLQECYNNSPRIYLPYTRQVTSGEVQASLYQRVLIKFVVVLIFQQKRSHIIILSINLKEIEALLDWIVFLYWQPHGKLYAEVGRSGIGILYLAAFLIDQ